MQRSRLLRRAGFVLALVASAILGTVLGSAVGGPSRDWGCSPERRGYSIFEFGEGGGSPTADGALVDVLELIASDGQRERSDYAAAMGSTSGPTRFDASTGELLIDDRLEAQIAVAQQPDGTWTIANIQLCMRAPEFSGPYPTPSLGPTG